MDKIINKNFDNNEGLTFIDRDEIEEMLREYYDFINVTETQWIALDKEIQAICAKRGISSDYSEEYARICDVCCNRLGFPSLSN